jgi:asparagine synthase (glutamine-hydrolysing)
MCGLFGVVGIELETDRINAENSLDTLVHRGPDQSGVWFEDGVFIGHRRLSIIDISENGRQPLLDQSGMVIFSDN